MASALTWLRLAARNVLRQKRRSVLCALTVAGGVLALVAQAGFSKGVLRYLEDTIARGSLGEIQIHRAGYLASASATPLSLAFKDSDELRDKIRAVPGVQSVSPHLAFAGMVTQGVGQTMVVLRAVDESLEGSTCPGWAMSVTWGQGRPTLGPRDVVLGQELASGLGVAPGAHVTVSAENGAGRTNALEVAVTGTLGGGMPIENKRVGMMSLSLAQELLGLQGEVTEYAVSVLPDSDPAAVVAGLKAALGPHYEVHTWRQAAPFWDEGLSYTSLMWFMSALLLSVVCIAGITAAQTMTVLERTREIGAMVSMGVKRRQVAALFLSEAVLLGAMAAVLGALVSAAMVASLGAVGIPSSALGMEDGQMIRPRLDVGLMALAMVGAVVVTVASALVPAMRAARLRPVDALAGRSG